MSDCDRKKISEIATQYKLEPSLIDIYVEGNIDKRIIEFFLDQFQFTDVNVYEINTIEVDVADDSIDNNKGRVISLCRLLDSYSDDFRDNYYGIVDKDRDFYLDKIIDGLNIIYTNFTSLELYLTNDKTLNKFYRFYLNRNNNSIKEKLEYILKRLFLLSVVNEALNLEMTTIRVSRLINVNGENLEFDFDEYYKRVLASNQLFKIKDQIDQELENLNYLLEDDFFQTVNYHDFITLFEFYIRNVHGNQEVNESFLSAGLLLAVEKSHIEEYPFFKKLLTILS